MNSLDHLNHPANPDHDPEKDLYWNWKSTVRDTGGRFPVIELQRRLSAAMNEQALAWTDFCVEHYTQYAWHVYQVKTRRVKRIQRALVAQFRARRAERMERRAA